MLGFTLAATVATHAQQAAREVVLDNGLKVVVQEDHRAPVVDAQIWYHVGSSHEHAGITGISHALEHMMFKGTERYGPGEFSRIIAAAGGIENAFTGQDFTAYFQRLERSRLPVSLELEADRMTALRLPPEEFRKEMEVVKEERRLRTEDNPEAAAEELARAVAYQVSPYRQPVIGWMDDLQSMTREDLARWYERWYAPDNATLVVVGDVDAESVFALARRYFGAIPAGATPQPGLPQEPPQQGMRRAQLELPAAVAYLIIDYKVPTLASLVAAGAEPAEAYAVEVLRALLAGDESARLPARLVRGRELATGIEAGYELYARLPGLLTITALPSRNDALAALEAAILEEVAALRSKGPEAGELARARTRLVSQRSFRLDSPFYRAMEIGMLEASGLGWRVRDDYDGSIAAVTAADVREVARKYLRSRGMTVTSLTPVPEPAS
jgi:zinc protease